MLLQMGNVTPDHSCSMQASAERQTNDVTHLGVLSRNMPRRNLPAAVSRKRGESSFVRAFERHLLSDKTYCGFGGSEFSLNGFGIADFVWLAWHQSVLDHEATGLALQQRYVVSRLAKRLERERLTAFELKLKDWKKALSQAHRYRYFANRSIVVVPPSAAQHAAKQIDVFKKLYVGLWSFDKTTQKLRKLFTPKSVPALNKRARERAIALLTRKILLSQSRKLRQTLKHRL